MEISTLQMIVDEREIIKGLGLFARMIDGKSWSEIGGVFADNVVFDYGDGTDQFGVLSLVATMRRYIDLCGPTQHLIGSIMVNVESDNATSCAYVQARHQRANDPIGAVFDSSGEYVDRWARLPEGWRIVRRDVIWHMHSGDPSILQLGL